MTKKKKVPEKKKKITRRSVLKKNKQKNKAKNKNKKNLLLICLMSFLIIFMSVLILSATYIIIFAPKFTASQLYEKESSILYDRNGKEIAKIGAENRELVTYDELPQVFVDALISVEDSRFFQHNGFDIARFMKASMGQLAGNKSAGGASTLTMQVSKNAFTTTESRGIQGLIRKFTDIYMSIFKIEKNFTKEEIIEFYVNSPYLGNYSYGVEAACQEYFGKSVSDLNLAEASLVAGLFQAPYTYNPYNNPDLAAKRRSNVLNLMVRHGYISKQERDMAEKIDVRSLLKANQKEKNVYQAFVDTVIDDVIAKTENDPNVVPMLIYTTMDPKIQDVINDVTNGVTYQFVNDVVQWSAAVTSTKDGAILAIGAGRNRVGERLGNLATQIKRHPGSAAKPFLDYGPIMEYNNASPATYFYDVPYSYSNGTSFTNADNSYNGTMTMKQALAQSRNIPALQAFQQVDNKKISEYVHNFGIDYGKELYESAAVGGFNGVSPLTLSSAFAVYGRGGSYIKPYSFTKIIYRQSERTYEHKPEEKQIISEENAFLMNYMLKYAISTNILGNMSVGNTDIAGKTGTSTMDASALKQYGYPGSTVMDSWANFYSPDYSVSMWYGYRENQKGYYMTMLGSASVRRNISQIVARSIMNTGSTWSVPKGVIRAEYEIGTAPTLKPSAGTPENLRGYEYFKAGTEPTEVSPKYQGLENPSGLKASNKGNVVTLNWNEVKGTNAINMNFLKRYYGNNFNPNANRYYDLIIKNNGTTASDVGYNVYLKKQDSLTHLGFTENNTFNYTVSGTESSYTFVVKTAYASNSGGSSGVQTTINIAPTNPVPSGNWDIYIDTDSFNPITINQSGPIPSIKEIYYNDGDNIKDSCTTSIEIRLENSVIQPNQLASDTTYKITYTIESCTGINIGTKPKFTYDLKVK